ncbi:acetoin dehydrogenase dihydrolipoyllysine-residue acetyltransferase subunit [Nordella sp. HKS 07]|uniref:acetoin dehydrogenase dihydrolipoyllysine-residue acetyltransferase subunit n=1 Tax=Nordella sp. HKS 07 TaxID=2712222 RepID=UPI0013E1C5F0|nr:acetoin dehydrogenase dihydrolipoyllysine-residue acetyltransferase subunit [Nordella sp. HKS 07]QIG47365.1 acetoin dehydrogenase dihydrolipoyllysine-residue acetyltransferase subunit [Nordella sp. HKS 07]
MSERIQAITMPKWGMTMTEGKLAGWLAGEGAEIAAGQEIMEVETEKITNVVEAQGNGRLRRIVVSEGATAPVGALLAVLADADVSDSDVEAFIESYADRAGSASDAAGDAPKARIVEAGAHRFKVLSLGSGGVPAVLIHGFGGDGGTWLFNQDALAQDRSVHVIDLPAHGDSEPTVASGRITDIADAVLSLFAALAIEKAHLVGHSLGGAVALAIANAAPVRVQSLTLIAPAGLGSEISAAYIDGFLAADRRKAMKEVLAMLFADPQGMNAEMVENVLRFKRLDGVPDALAAIAGQLMTDGMQAIDLRAVLTGSAVPALVIWGEADQIIPVGQSEGLNGNIDVARLAGAGHMPMMEQAAQVNRLITAHLAKAGG